MSELSKNLNSRVQSVIMLKAQATAATETLQTTGIDTALYQSGKIVISTGTCTDGAYDPQVQTSATVGGSYAVQTVANSEYVAGVAPTQITTTADETLYVYDLNLGKLDNRFLKLNLHETTGGTTGVVISAVFEGVLREAA